MLRDVLLNGFGLPSDPVAPETSEKYLKLVSHVFHEYNQLGSSLAKLIWSLHTLYPAYNVFTCIRDNELDPEKGCYFYPLANRHENKSWKCIYFQEKDPIETFAE